jgi:putative ABC transport system permease protein
MNSLWNRLFFRIILKGREVYLLKIVTLAVAFACTTLVVLFSIHEFGFDRIHDESVFRIIQRNNSESFSGNRLSNRIPPEIYSQLKSKSDSINISRVKILNGLTVIAHNKVFYDSKFHAADSEINNVFTFQLLDGSWDNWDQLESSVILSSSTASQLFGNTSAVDQRLKIVTHGDTLVYSVAAVYRDFPKNSHEEFYGFLPFESSALESLHFNPKHTGLYGKVLQGEHAGFENALSKQSQLENFTYSFQPISEIYFGPRVVGEEAKHGDHYSILILICLTILTLFLALTSFINLTTLTLPFRSKELAIKKLAGTSQTNLVLGFARESLLIVGLSLLLGVSLLILFSNWINSILSIDPIALLLKADLFMILVLASLLVAISLAPLMLTWRFTNASPTRLLSVEPITFPRFKRTIIFLQLGISIFLIVASMVMRRQISYSLLKEPGRNHEQVVYVNYPKDLTIQGLNNLRSGWKKNHPNIVDVMGTSQLPNNISSKELSSEFYFLSVDRGFKDFFDIEMIDGNWFGANTGDSVILVNAKGKKLLGNQASNIGGVYRDFGDRFNQPAKPIKLSTANYFDYNFLCIRVLEVDIRRTVDFLSNYFKQGDKKATVSFLDKHFEEWLLYQDKLNKLSGVLALVAAALSCFAIYGLSVSIVRDKIKQIAVRKLLGADTFGLTRLLVKEFISQLVKAVLVFGPLTYIILNELLRSFVYSTHFHWLDPIVPIAYCLAVIALLCGFQVMSLNREDLSAALKA